MKPFKRGRLYWARFPREKGKGAQRSLDVGDLDSAKDRCEFLSWLKRRGNQSWLLGALADGTVEIGPAYTAYIDDTLAAFVERARHGDKDPDLQPKIDQWMREMERRRQPAKRQRDKYLAQIRTCIPAGEPFPASELTRQTVRAWLAKLTVGQPNRYRAAMSSFCQFLVLEEVIAINPVTAIPASKESPPRRRHLSPDEALSLVRAMPQPFRALHALMVCTAIESEVALKLRARDIDREARVVMARGTKRAHRQRTARVYDTWDAMWAEVESYLAGAGLLPDAKAFPEATYYRSRAALQRACAALKVADYTTHDHRHTWAVQAVRDGLPINTVSHQLGHRDAVMTLRVYGAFVPAATDYQTRKHTKSHTITLTKEA